MKVLRRLVIASASILIANTSMADEPRMHRINWDYGGFAAVGIQKGSELRYCHTWDDPGKRPIAASNCGAYGFVKQDDGLLRIDNIADGTMWFRITDKGAAATFKNKKNGKTYRATAAN